MGGYETAVRRWEMFVCWAEAREVLKYLLICSCGQGPSSSDPHKPEDGGCYPGGQDHYGVALLTMPADQELTFLVSS